MSADLFQTDANQGALPLASRMRPRSLDEYVGQQHLLADGMPGRKAIEEGKLGSVVLWAPPGCGKTTLAHIVARHMDAAYVGSQFKVDEGSYFLLLAVVLVYAALHLLVKVNETKSPTLKRNLAVVLASGAIIGLLSGVVGVGGGIFLSPLIVLLGWADAKTAAATSAMFIFVNSLAGIFGRMSLGTFAPQHLLPLIVVASLGGLLGSLVGAKRFSNLAVRRTLSIVLFVAAAKLFADFFGA